MKTIVLFVQEAIEYIFVEDEEISYTCEIAIQTDAPEDIFDTQTPTSELEETEDIQLVDFEIQTDYKEYITSETQTEEKESVDADIQTETTTHTIDTQTDELESSAAESQTEYSTNSIEIQTEVQTLDIYIQTEIASFEIETQTETCTSEMDIQTDTTHTFDSSMQTEIDVAAVETQTEVCTSDISIQTDLKGAEIAQLQKDYLRVLNELLRAKKSIQRQQQVIEKLASKVNQYSEAERKAQKEQPTSSTTEIKKSKKKKSKKTQIANVTTSHFEFVATKLQKRRPQPPPSTEPRESVPPMNSKFKQVQKKTPIVLAIKSKQQPRNLLIHAFRKPRPVVSIVTPTSQLSEKEECRQPEPLEQEQPSLNTQIVNEGLELQDQPENIELKEQQEYLAEQQQKQLREEEEQMHLPDVEPQPLPTPLPAPPVPTSTLIQPSLSWLSKEQPEPDHPEQLAHSSTTSQHRTEASICNQRAKLDPLMAKHTTTNTSSNPSIVPQFSWIQGEAKPEEQPKPVSRGTNQSSSNHNNLLTTHTPQVVTGATSSPRENIQPRQQPQQQQMYISTGTFLVPRPATQVSVSPEEFFRKAEEEAKQCAARNKARREAQMNKQASPPTVSTLQSHESKENDPNQSNRQSTTHSSQVQPPASEKRCKSKHIKQQRSKSKPVEAPKEKKPVPDYILTFRKQSRIYEEIQRTNLNSAFRMKIL